MIPLFFQVSEQALLDREIHLLEFFVEQNFTVLDTSVIPFDCLDCVYTISDAIQQESSENLGPAVGEHQATGNALSRFIDAHQAQHCLFGSLLVLLSHGVEGKGDTLLEDSLPDLGVVKQRPILVKNDSLEFLHLLCHVSVSYGTNRLLC